MFGLKTMRRVMGLIVLGGMVLTATGCSKQLANFSLSQATKRLEEAKGDDAQQFDPQGLANVQDLINQTQQSINGAQYKDARATGKEAATQAKQLVERVKNSRATFLKSESNKWIDILELNDGRAENPNLFEQVLASNEEGIAAYDKQKWDQSIQAFDKAVNDANFLLENLKRRAEDGLKDVASMKERLIEEGAPDHYPEAIIEIDDLSGRIEDLIVNKNDYRTALITRDQAKQRSDAGILKTKEIKSDKLLRQVETMLGNAVVLGAEIHAKRSLDTLNEEFENLLKQFYEQKYDTVLTSGPGLVPKAEALIVETQRESARAKLDAVRQAIASLIEGKAKTYLPGHVEQLEQTLAQGQTLFDEAKYTETEQLALKALDDERKIIDEFDTLAQQEITNGSGQLTIAESVFTRMEDIFSKRTPGATTADDESLEKAKEGMREELRARIRNAKLELGLATLKKDDKVFHEAIEISKRVGMEADAVVQQTYRVVAHNSIQEISNQLSRYEREGGRVYTPEQMNKSQEVLLSARQAVNEGDYRKAVELSAAAHATLETMAQELGNVAVQRIEAAEKAIAEAAKRGADQYQPDQLNQIKVDLQKAQDLLAIEGLREAIQTAEDAMQRAQATEQESLRQWAEEEMRKTDVLLARADEAGANRYAPRLLSDAKSLRQNAQRLYDAGNMNEAQAVGAEAAQAANNALYAQVIAAEDAVAEASRSRGWEYEQTRLADAIVSTKYARQFLDEGNYSLSTAHAREATVKALNAARDAREAAFADRMKALESKVNDASRHGAGYYQIGELANIVGEIQELETQFEPNEQGYEQAQEKIELLNAQIEGLIATTPDKLRELVENMNQQLAGLESAGARSHAPDLTAEVANKIKYAQLDYRNERYRNSYQNARDAARLLDMIQLRLAERDYDQRLNESFMQLSQILQDFAPVLNMGSPVMVRMIQDVNGRSRAVAMMSASNPTDLRQAISDLGAQVALMTPPPTREDVHQASLEMINTAKNSAAAFEKLLILDQYSPNEARQIINSAYLQMASARNRQQELQRTLETPLPQTQQAGVRRALETRP